MSFSVIRYVSQSSTCAMAWNIASMGSFGVRPNSK